MSLRLSQSQISLAGIDLQYLLTACLFVCLFVYLLKQVG